LLRRAELNLPLLSSSSWNCEAEGQRWILHLARAKLLRFPSPIELAKLCPAGSVDREPDSGRIQTGGFNVSHEYIDPLVANDNGSDMSGVEWDKSCDVKTYVGRIRDPVGEASIFLLFVGS
jgi:hypothetical protein